MSQENFNDSGQNENNSENSNILLKERYDLMKWTNNVELRTPNLLIPVQIANYIESLPFCKLAVSPKCDRVALMSYTRQLDIYTLTGEILEHESSVQVLEETCPEYCLLQFTSSGSLLLSSRSTPHIDVFDNLGAYCYDILLENHDGIFNVDSAICCMQTIPNHAVSSNDKFIEILYVLQYSGTFSAFKIGRLSKYTKMWSVQLDIAQTGSFLVLPQYNLLLVASHYKESTLVNPPGGLCSFRMMDSDPYVEPIRISSPENGWFSKLPFSASFMSYLPKLSLSYKSHLLISVATSGSLYIFEIPSTHLKFTFNYISGPKPVEACFVDDEEVAIIYDTGVLLRCRIENIEEQMYSMKMTNKKEIDVVSEKDIYTSHTVMITPAQREIFLISAEGDSSVLREAAHKRVQLAGQLWFYTVWNSFKKLVGMAMGESAEPLQMATHVARYEFSLVHSPTRTLQELFNRTLVEHNYSRARELANNFESIDIDIVLKAEWEDKCEKEKVNVDDVNNILHKVRDTEWVAKQCVNVNAGDFEVQKSLIDLGLSLSETSIMWKIRLLHNMRLLEVCKINEDIETYLRARNGSCLEAVLTFANNGDMESVLRMVETNLKFMKNHQKEILSSFPTCIYPTKFEHFLPKKNLENSEIEQWELEEMPGTGAMELLEKIAAENPDARCLIENVNIGKRTAEKAFDFVDWVRQRLRQIDFECGLTENCVSLLKIGCERGFEELTTDLPKWELYSKFVTICSSVSESISSFEDASVKTLTDKFSRLLESELIEHSSTIISIIEWKCKSSEEEEKINEKIKETLTNLMMSTNERTTKVLVEFRKQREDLIDDKVILDCLLNMTTTGGDLLQSLGYLPVEKYTNVTSSLSSLMSRGVKMTFKSIFESMKEPDGARRVLIKLSRSGNCETLEDWTQLKDDVMQMAQGIYTDLITKEEALELIAGEILEDEKIGQYPELMGLVLTLSSKEPANENKLSWKKSAEVLLSKSDDLMSEATHRDDPLLGKSRFFAIAARSISADQAKEKLRWLDAIELAQELGCTMMPISIKLTDHDVLLHQIVHIGNNYKHGKKVAKLALLLDIETPVATALSYCALAALTVNDATYLSRYINEVISKAKGIGVVHHLCMKIMESKHVPTDMGDIYACALNNCTPENLLATVDAISNSEKRLENEKKKNIENWNIPLFDTIVQDPMYTSINVFKPRNEIDEAEKKKIVNLRKLSKNLKLEESRKIVAIESVTLALCQSLFVSKFDENESWTKNEKLKRYEKSLRYFEKRASLAYLVKIQPSVLIHAASQNDETISAIDRIEDYGCDKNRFINDSEYREDAIIGLAMTEIDQQFNDALELAKTYNIDEWQLHMTSLENALIYLPIAEAKRVLKSRGHLAKLRTRIDELHKSLRSSVFPLILSNEQFIAYTSLFADSEPEKKVAPIIIKILEKRKDLKAKEMWSQPTYLANVLVTIPDKVLWTIIEKIQMIPIGKKATELAAQILLDGTELRPPANPLTLFFLVSKELEDFFDIVAVKSRTDEIEYFEKSIGLLEATSNTPNHLIEAIKDRLEKMRRSTVSPVNEQGEIERFLNSPTDDRILKRRKN